MAIEINKDKLVNAIYYNEESKNNGNTILYHVSLDSGNIFMADTGSLNPYINCIRVEKLFNASINTDDKIDSEILFKLFENVEGFEKEAESFLKDKNYSEEEIKEIKSLADEIRQEYGYHEFADWSENEEYRNLIENMEDESIEYMENEIACNLLSDYDDIEIVYI